MWAKISLAKAARHVSPKICARHDPFIIRSPPIILQKKKRATIAVVAVEDASTQPCVTQNRPCCNVRPRIGLLSARFSQLIASCNRATACMRGGRRRLWQRPHCGKSLKEVKIHSDHSRECSRKHTHAHAHTGIPGTKLSPREHKHTWH